MGKILGGLIGISIGGLLFFLFYPHWSSWIGVVMASGSLFQLVSEFMKEGE
jgi:hypothetical protein